MVRGPLPRIAVLGPRTIPQPELVKLQTSVIPPPPASSGKMGLPRNGATHQTSKH